ncbi:MAG TPA: branched-chain amino acid ABC transporter permease, partial [Clostridia bacterium]|nr:branched-chain amino acid ABC transporter permease [Clostridia bacterium]
MINLEFIINTISLGSLYALISLGLVIVYGILQLVNFAYGELIMITGYVIFWLSTSTSLPIFVIIIFSVVAAALVSALTEIVAFRPVRNKSTVAIFTTSFAVSMLLQNMILIVVSPRARAVPLPEIFNRSVEIFGVVTSMRNVLTIITTIVMLLALSLLMKKTMLGTALRAATNNFTASRLMGVPANMIISVAFLLSGMLAGTAALFWVGRSASVDPLTGAAPLQIAFIATVIGGMNSLVGAVVGGYVYGLLFNLLSVFLPPSVSNYRDAFMFFIVILFLLFRPEGIVRGSY